MKQKYPYMQLTHIVGEDFVGGGFWCQNSRGFKKVCDMPYFSRNSDDL